MRRRTLLTLAGAGALSLAGCLADETPPADDSPGTPGDDSTDTPDDDPSDGDDTGGGDDSDDLPEPTDPRYETCHREVIPSDVLPAELRAEVDAALDGGYEADRVFLREAMDVDDSYVEVGSAYYDPTVAATDDGERLTLARVVPKALPRERSISVDHSRDAKLSVTIELVAEDGTVLIDRTRELWGSEVEFGSTRRVGTHDLHVTVSDDGEVIEEWSDSITVSESYFDFIVVIEEDDVYVTGAVADLAVCRFEE